MVPLTPLDICLCIYLYLHMYVWYRYGTMYVYTCWKHYWTSTVITWTMTGIIWSLAALMKHRRRFSLNVFFCNFSASFISARQHICYSALYAIARPSVRLSVCPSVCLSVTRVDQSKTVEVRITQPSPQSSPMTLVA